MSTITLLNIIDLRTTLYSLGLCAMPNLQHKLLSTTYSEIWLTGLEKTPFDRCQPQLAPYTRRIYDINVTLNSVFTLDCKKLFLALSIKLFFIVIVKLFFLLLQHGKTIWSWQQNVWGSISLHLEHCCILCVHLHQTRLLGCHHRCNTDWTHQLAV